MSHLWKPYLSTQWFSVVYYTIKVATEFLFLAVLVSQAHTSFGIVFKEMCIFLITIHACCDVDSNELHHMGGMGVLRYRPHFRTCWIFSTYSQYTISIEWHFAKHIHIHGTILILTVIIWCWQLFPPRGTKRLIKQNSAPEKYWGMWSELSLWNQSQVWISNLLWLRANEWTFPSSSGSNPCL